MNNPYLTLISVVALNPCHDAETLRAWYPDHKRVRLSTVLKDDRITHADRMWLAVRVLPGPVVKRWVEVVIDRAVRRSVGTSACPAWESWAKNWLSSADRTDRTADAAADAAAAARAAADAAAQVAARVAADAAAVAAWAARAAEARAAEVEVEWIARAAATAYAAELAARARGAWAAERDQQIADLLECMAMAK